MKPTRTGAPPSLPLDRSVGYQVRMTHRLIQVLWVQDGLTQSELSAEIGTMEPTTLSAVASMEAAGLVRRERDGTDKRKVHVFLTEKGRAMRDTLLPEGIAVVNASVRSLGPRQVDTLLKLLKTMQANLAAEMEGRVPARRTRRITDE